MAEELTAAQFLERLDALKSDEQAASYTRSFKPGDDDTFIGVRMGDVFKLAKEFMAMPLDEVEALLESPIHEARVGAVSVLDYVARAKKATDAQKQAVYELYLRRHDRINNWDLVDRSAIWVVGGYLYDKPRDVLYELARSANLWERRTAMVATAYFIRMGDLDDTFRIAEMLLDDGEDLIHKATGWMLRSAGSSDRERLVAFLDAHAAQMPRVALRYALEHFDKAERAHYMEMKRKA